VDDNDAWRRQIRLLLQVQLELQIICEVSDGAEAVQKAAELKPDLILLDIGLPKLNGIKAARQIRQLSPNSKIIFLSQDNSPDVVQEALNTGGLAYVHKPQAGSELLPTVKAVLRGERFVSSSLKGHKLTSSPVANALRYHEVLFYSDDAAFLESFTRCIAAALRAGNAAIVNVTKSHLDSLIHRLKAEGVDIDRAIQRGTFVALDASETFSATMVNGLPDPVRFLSFTNGFIEAVAETTKVEHPRIVLCGEGVGLLWVEGKKDAAFRVEQLCNVLAETHDVDVLCAYPLSSFRGDEDRREFHSVCREHSSVCSR
jgi:CheY-like chemotaxis protein